MESSSSWLKRHKLGVAITSITAFVAILVGALRGFDYLDRICQFLVRSGTNIDQTSNVVVVKVWFVIVMIATVLVVVGLASLVWAFWRGKPSEPGELAEQYKQLTTQYKQLTTKHEGALQLLGGMMNAVSRIRNQFAPVGKPDKSFEYVRITYYIEKDFSAEVIRAYGIRTAKEPLHFWTVGNAPTEKGTSFLICRLRMTRKQRTWSSISCPESNRRKVLHGTPKLLSVGRSICDK